MDELQLTAWQEALLYEHRIPFVHMTPTVASAKLAKVIFKRAVEERGLTLEDVGVTTYDLQRKPGGASAYRFISCELRGSSCEHVPILVLQDSHLMDPLALKEALLIPVRFGLIPPQTVYINSV